MTAINPQAVRGPVTAIPVVAGVGVQFREDVPNNRVIAETDETVLSSTATVVGIDVEINLSESYTNFQSLKVFAIRNPTAGQCPACNEFMVDADHNVINFMTPLLTAGSTDLIIDTFKGTLTSTKLTITAFTRKTFSGTTMSTATNAPVTITKIVGINRIA